MVKKRLGVNIDHVATIRNVRGENYPNPLNPNPPPPKEPDKRQYITIDPNLITEMDTYIKTNYK